MTPDYERAATAAAETLVKFGINSAPISPLPILKQLPGVLVVSYQDLSEQMEMDRKCVMAAYGHHNQDAFTSVSIVNGKPHYIITYNQQLSQVLVQRSLARELAHIVLGHDGSRPVEVRDEEARCFANHLLVPRALIHALQASAVRVTVDVLGSLTGCYDYCLSCMRRIPAVHVPAELNRAVRDQFMPYFINFFEYHNSVAGRDGSALSDFGTYMEGYDE